MEPTAKPAAKPAAASSKKRKPPDEEIPKIEDLKWEPLQLPYQERDPQLNLPSNLDMSNPYSLFSLFFTEEIFEKISHSTNLYAQLQ